MTDGFREVLHAWALDQLNAGAKDHTGPFEVLSVRLDHDYGGSVENESVNVSIQFRHHGCTAFTWTGHVECGPVTSWSPLVGSVDTVRLLNELLAKGDAA